MSNTVWCSLGLAAVLSALVILELVRHSISKWIRHWWSNPYEKDLSKRIRVRVGGRGPDGKRFAQDAPRLLAVSRHGLVRPPIICPCCGPSVGLSALSFRDVIETRWGEALVCPQCQAYLLASPDDDVDDVTTDFLYDENVYHKFVRRSYGDRPPQRTIRKDPEKGDWVVITEHIPNPGVDGAGTQDLWGGEGRVEDLDLQAGTARVSLGGVSGLAGSDYGGVFATLPIRAIAVLASQSLRVGDEVRVTRGDLRGEVGRVRSIVLGKPYVSFNTAPEVHVPIERLEKVQETL
jgi:hypothetical protein